MRLGRLTALTLLLAVGCSTPKREEGPSRPVRFAVIAAPEMGTDDTLLLQAITRLSREAELDFVLVPGPLLATGADESSLDLLKNDLGQLAPPVYVGFAVVSSEVAAACKLKREEILTALEKMGPGDEHAVSYNRIPPRQPNVIVDVLAPDGKDSLEKWESERVISLGRATSPHGPKGLIVLVGAKETRLDDATISVAPLGIAKAITLVTVWPERLEVQPLALEGPDPPPLEKH